MNKNNSFLLKVNHTLKYSVLIVLFVLVFLCGATIPKVRPIDWAQPIINTNIDNLYMVSDELFRAKQPTKKNIPDLKSLHIRTLLNLREYHKDSIVFVQNGFDLVHHRMDAKSVSIIDMVKVLKLLHNAEKPVLIHCWHGSDRTGFIVAGYRIIF